MSGPKILVYLACPYSGTDLQRHIRFVKACWAAGVLMQLGYSVYSPITHNHPIKEMVGLPAGWEFWKEHDERMLSCCDELHILTLPGWETSRGVTAEVEMAKALKKPVWYIHKDTFELFSSSDQLKEIRVEK